MTTRQLHYFSGLTITIFVSLHLLNHTISVVGIERHIEFMTVLRNFYRNIFIESILLLGVVIQIFSGLKLFFSTRRTATTTFKRIHIYSGLYLAFFLTLHVTAVMGGRLVWELDTNFYFGAAGINAFPYSLFFVPYYALAIISFWGHLASIHHKKMQQNVFGLTPHQQAKAILIFGFLLTFVIFYGVTNHFHGISLPNDYNILVGK